MSAKRESDGAEPSPKRQKFKLRGDLRILQNGDQSGHFNKILNTDKVSGKKDKRKVITMEPHSANDIKLVLEFIYGAGMIEIVEYPSTDQPLIQNCILLYNLGHDFEIPDLTKYAEKHLGFYLSRKLNEICIYPFSEAVKAVGRNKFIEDFEAGINEAEKVCLADRKLPLFMLVDFAVVGRDVLFRDPTLRWDVSEDSLPSSFVKEVFLAQFRGTYHTTWMKNLMVKPEKEIQRRRKCVGCGEGVSKEDRVVFNPWSGVRFPQRYQQVCCEECAQSMDQGQGAGVSWRVFDDTEE
ncbi:hypothetical protein J7T55_007734 [Diaporthe amygdali]|uniref:uncharacterized protein n=1 Tax=Phomopsis amygdali TaxID=1214568 RepID=UPI0022FF2B31|nr:uncharacterized protein J7T55_007734 [Diaporthe amygdali]KAJ0107544.1 hypothetical protein J7T55_007734 [Diaporthe amygdali]